MRLIKLCGDMATVAGVPDGTEMSLAEIDEIALVLTPKRSDFPSLFSTPRESGPFDNFLKGNDENS